MKYKLFEHKKQKNFGSVKNLTDIVTPIHCI